MEGEKKDLIRVDEIVKSIKLARQEGKDILLNEDADRAIAYLKFLESEIEVTLKAIKSQMPEVMLPFNAKTIRGKYCRITVGNPKSTSLYRVDESEVEDKFITRTTTVKVVPNHKAILEYKKQNKSLPVGVYDNNPPSVVSIAVISSVIDDEEYIEA